MTSTPDTAVVDRLRAELDGQFVGPGDGEYDAARTVFVGGIDRRPAVIVRPTDADGVARVVSVARDTGLDLAVRSGGHSGAGHSVCEGGIMLDLSRMRALEVDVEGHTAWAQTGLTASGYTTAVGEHGLATGFGDTGSVGIGGITLGGGVGFLSRKYGLTIDDVLAAEVVTADGTLLHVDADNEPDLFWALRGGGGNFGVVTRFRYRLNEVPTVVGGMLMLQASADVLTKFLAEADAAPDELSTIANVMPVPPIPFIPAEHHGSLVLMALVCYAGPPEDGERVLAPFRSLATPLVDMVKPMPYPAIFLPEDPDYHPTAVARTLYVNDVSTETAETVIERIRTSDAPMRVAQLRMLGGAVARVAPDATAYAHRTSRIMANVAAFYTGPADLAEREAWVLETADLLRQDDAGVYVNFLGAEGPERVRAAYPGATWDRLVEVKRRYDPTNVFRLNQNIPPDGA
ncbi:MAG: FAD-binding protein [Propionibacteriales bacterium]|nr:FAD-binding protein [Propionibacteriales bacterium]